jgi:phosphotransferase family enzyme
VLSPALPPLADVLAAHDLIGIPEEPFPNDGWSGALLTRLTRGDQRFVLKRDSVAADWIARATRDGPVLREAWFAAAYPNLPPPARAPYLGVGRLGDEFGLLMPDLSGVLFDWSRAIDMAQLDRVLEAVRVIHDAPVPSALVDAAPWCPLRERVLLISRPAVAGPGPAHDAVGDRILPGWDAFARFAPGDALELVASLSSEPGPLLRALGRRRQCFLHGDLKLANAGIAADGYVELVDWQMVMLGPVEVELGWFLAANVATLPLAADEVLARYDTSGDLELAWIVGLLLRGWRKGYDAEAGVVHPSGMSAVDDLALWSRRAVAASRAL